MSNKKELNDFFKGKESEGYTIIDNPTGSGKLAYNDYYSYAVAMLTCNLCPNCRVKLVRKHWWSFGEKHYPKCGHTVVGV
jgi:hypothetical protein